MADATQPVEERSSRRSPAASWRSSAPLNRLMVLLGSAFVLAAAGGVVLILSFPAPAPGFEIGRSLLALAVALLVGGVATVVLKQAEQNRAETVRQADLDRAERAEWAELLRHVVGVDEAVATARQLLLAHRTAKTYGEQYRTLLTARLTLRRVIGDPLVTNSDHDLADGLRTMLTYLDRLGTEYEGKYLRVARQQLIDEQRLTTMVTAAAARPDDPPATDPVYDPMATWQMLDSRSDFPFLGNLLDPRTYASDGFVPAYAEVKQILERRCGIARTAPYTPFALGDG